LVQSIAGRPPDAPAAGSPREDEAAVRGEGLLHDARNLMGTLGLYCDLLERPGVLKLEHLHYAAEVRLVGVQSGDLLERLVALVDSAEGDAGADRDGGGSAKNSATTQLQADRLAAFGVERKGKPVSLRAVVERCSGLLSRLAGGREIEITYGAASAVPVPVAGDAVERILVNLVRNAAAALDPAAGATGLGNGRCDAASAAAQGDGDAERGGSRRLGEQQDPTSDESSRAIRIGVGLLVNRVGDAKPWPFRRVRLVVEDAGRGMSPDRLDRLLTGRTAQVRGGHGIGFRVVRDLVAASNGDLSAMSAPGIGTRVQIEWPMAAPLTSEAERSGCGLAGDAELAEPAAASFGGPHRLPVGTPRPPRTAGARHALRWPPGGVKPPKLRSAIARINLRDLADVPSMVDDFVATNPQEPRPHVERMDA